MNEKDIKKQIFDNVYEPNMSSKKIEQVDKLYEKEMFGTLEIIGRDDSQGGKIIHHEEPSRNKILIWAKHAIMKMMSGDVMARWGANRTNPSGTVSSGKGTMISNKQFFTSDSNSYTDTFNYTAENFIYYNQMKFPYFPTKMLFGTGLGVNGSLFPSTNDVNAFKRDNITNQDDLVNISTEGWVQSVHSDSLITGTIDDYSIAKDKTWTDFTNTTYNTSLTGEPSNIWLPSFVYMNRTRPFESVSEMKISKHDEAYDEYNKITYTVILPSQLDGRWYPYNNESTGNGVQLKYAGLFCDAAFIEYSGSSEKLLSKIGEPSSAFTNGMMWAKRAITPITKTNNISLEFKWSIYLPRETL